jgi:geranylgeranyl pyrophosphate synthase
VILGQMIDVDLMSRKRTTSSVIRRKVELKTARYTFVRPMRVGGMLAGAKSSFLSFCETVGLALGTAFQIQDDLLDLTSTTATLQKGVFSDLQDRQHTLFTQHIFEKGTRGEQAMLNRYFGKKIEKKDRAKILSLFHDSGAIQAGSSEMERNFKRAEAPLASLKIPKEKREEWLSLVQLIRQRIS